MYPTQIPVKTTKGLKEVADRTYQLSNEIRRVLIMVNGHTDLIGLRKKLVGFGDIESIMQQLEIDGFIAPKPDSSPIPVISHHPNEVSHHSQEVSHRPNKVSQQPHTHSHSAPTHAEFNLEKAKGFIRFVLFAALGPTAERRINRIDATTTAEELRVELDAIHEMLPRVLSKQEAHQAWRQLEPIMASIHIPPS